MAKESESLEDQLCIRQLKEKLQNTLEEKLREKDEFEQQLLEAEHRTIEA